MADAISSSKFGILFGMLPVSKPKGFQMAANCCEPPKGQSGGGGGGGGGGGTKIFDALFFNAFINSAS
jgi:hypothetical protein